MQYELISSDFNGTLARRNAMSRLIRLGDRPEMFETVRERLKIRLAGKMSMGEYLKLLGASLKGVSLKEAMVHCRKGLELLEGFENLLKYLKKENLPLVINTTSFSFVMYALREQYGKEYFDGFICNRMEFGWNGDPERAIDEEELEEMIEAWYRAGKFRKFDSYKEVKATGRVSLDIEHERSKSEQLKKYLKIKHPDIAFKNAIHIGDSFGDSRIMTDLARVGGIGIAFNYNSKLEEHLVDFLNRRMYPGMILMASPKNPENTLDELIKVLDSQ